MSFFQIVSDTLDSPIFQAILNRVIEQKLLGIRIPQFYSLQACQEIVERAYQHDFLWINPELGRIGGTIAQFHSHPEGKKHYFDMSPHLISNLQWIFAEYKHPIEKIARLFPEQYSCQLAFDSEYQQHYFPGMIQIQQKAGNVHVDRVQYESSDWSIAHILTQFSTVLYLQLPENGGTLELYNRAWKPEDLEFEFSRDPKIRTGVDAKLVEGYERLDFIPQTGDLLIFNTNYYHRVLQSFGNQPRITSLSFFGINNQNELLFFM